MCCSCPMLRLVLFESRKKYPPKPKADVNKSLSNTRLFSGRSKYNRDLKAGFDGSCSNIRLPRNLDTPAKVDAYYNEKRLSNLKEMPMYKVKAVMNNKVMPNSVRKRAKKIVATREGEVTAMSTLPWLRDNQQREDQSPILPQIIPDQLHRDGSRSPMISPIHLMNRSDPKPWKANRPDWRKAFYDIPELPPLAKTPFDKTPGPLERLERKLERRAPDSVPDTPNTAIRDYMMRRKAEQKMWERFPFFEDERTVKPKKSNLATKLGDQLHSAKIKTFVGIKFDPKPGPMFQSNRYRVPYPPPTRPDPQNEGSESSFHTAMSFRGSSSSLSTRPGTPTYMDPKDFQVGIRRTRATGSRHFL